MVKGKVLVSKAIVVEPNKACDCIVKERPKIIENIDFLCAEEKMSLITYNPL
jgi:hypothetical protein